MPKQKWEYKVTSEERKHKYDMTTLNKHMKSEAADGWELLGPPVWVDPLFLFQWKRPV
tara:strand:+ start:1702 stop:1875 length:174 start_codon:yes stop_codon:yes gene_type:complete